MERPIKLAVLHDTGELNYPAWEMRKADIDKAPYLYANTPKFELLESGPAKAAIKVSRQLGVSKVEQVISLDAGSSCIRVENAVDWHGKGPNDEEYAVAMQELNAAYAALEQEDK